MLPRSVTAMILTTLMPLAYAELALPAPELVEQVPATREAREGLWCDYHHVESIENENSQRTFINYASSLTDASELRKSVPHRSRIYSVFHSTLAKEFSKDNLINLRSTDDRGVTRWEMPQELQTSYEMWANDLATYKKRLEIDLCRITALESQLSEHQDMPVKFVETYNAVYDAYIEVATRCKKPETTDWTQDPAAKDYVLCSRASTREHNGKLRELKSYQNLRESLAAHLELHGLASRLRPALE